MNNSNLLTRLWRDTKGFVNMRRLDFVEGTIRPTMVLLFLLALISFSCEEEELKIIIPPHVPTLAITVDDVGVTEAWLNIESVDSAALGNIILKHDTTVVLTANVTTRETLVVSEQLLPQKTYTYKAYKLTNNTPNDSTTPLQLTTMDTTSHDIVWHIDTLGDGASSILYDVAIVNDTCVWVVGDINYQDSAGNWLPIYNAARWDGRKWNLHRILVRDFGTVTGYFPLITLYAFSPNNIWFASYADLIHWDGTTFTSRAFFGTTIPFKGQVTQMWGTSSNNIYCTGRTGSIYHYNDNGNTWQKLVTGTQLDIQDIWGAQTKTGEWEILAVASNPFSSYERKILRIDGVTVSELSDNGIDWPLSSIWFKPNRHYYVAGSGVYEKRTLEEQQWKNEPLDITTYYTNRIRGTKLNNVLFCGAYGDLFHFNGFDWYSYRPQTQLSFGQYQSLDTKGNIVVAVGDEYARAVVARGYRSRKMR
ncbi:MAG: hypothetical protein HYZ34_10695 [Ignavibacteriae bacterium]|nr:hypothetical protein [Ignavibacteriota bacterium]